MTWAGAGRFVSGRAAWGIAVPGAVLALNPGVPQAGGVLDERGWSYRALYLDEAA